MKNQSLGQHKVKVTLLINLSESNLLNLLTKKRFVQWSFCRIHVFWCVMIESLNDSFNHYIKKEKEKKSCLKIIQYKTKNQMTMIHLPKRCIAVNLKLDIQLSIIYPLHLLVLLAMNETAWKGVVCAKVVKQGCFCPTSKPFIIYQQQYTRK